MSLNSNHLYLFGDFSFDAEEKVLLRGGKPLQMTPKTLELLGVLIESHGRIVEKETLMAEVWADSFVEDSNLTFTVRQLRKALADSAHEPTYIETVPRRGYRFIGEVREIADEAKAAFLLSKANPPPARKEFAGRKSKNFYLLLIAVAVFLVGTIALGGWYTKSGKEAIDAPVLNAPFSSEKLSTDGKVHHAVVSPDGKNVVYTSGFKDKQSVWLRQLETSNSVEIIPPSDDFYYGLAMSPDGNFLYFARKPKNVERQSDIYRISIFGGVPQRIVTELSLIHI
jgi:DNA-binding winged helix-turn-helix (wHTH) protein